MKRKQTIVQISVWLSALFIIVSCSNKRQYTHSKEITWGDFGDSIPISGQDMSFNEEIAKPVRIYFSDSILYLINMNTDRLIQLLSVKSEKTIGSYISFGSGPGEMLSPHKISINSDTLFIYDLSQRKLSSYLLKTGEQPVPINTILFKSTFSDILVISDTCFIASVLDPAMGKLSFFQKDSLVKSGGEYPNIKGEGNTDKLEQLEGFASSMAFNKEAKKIAVVHKQTDLIEFYDLQGDLKQRLHGPEHFFPVVTLTDVAGGRKVISEKGKSRDAYFSPITVDDELFVLFSGKVYNRQAADYLREWILVFDWNGRPLRRYKLDKPIFSFTVDKNERVIYGLTDAPEFHIIKYRY